jgi:hypothetical protein
MPSRGSLALFVTVTPAAAIALAYLVGGAGPAVAAVFSSVFILGGIVYIVRRTEKGSTDVLASPSKRKMRRRRAALQGLSRGATSANR